MLIDNLIHYRPHHLYNINEAKDPFYYFLDYDERTYDINMEFQHYHRFYELCIFLDHAANHIIEGDFYDIECGDIVFLRPLLLHKTQYPEGKPSKRLIINFNFPLNVTGIEGCYDDLFSLFYNSVPIYRFEGIEKKKIFDSLNKLKDLTEHPHRLSNLLIHQQFIHFLTQIYLAKDKNIYKKKSSLDSLSEKIYNITSYIHNNYSDDLSLSALSKLFYISECYLSHQFKKITGFTVTDYIQITRVRMVQNLLITTNSDISDIAFSCGFNSFSQFNRVFRKHTSMSPSAFRKKQ